MESVVPRPPKVEIGFTDDRLTGTGGAAFLAEAAKPFGLLPRLAAAVSVKRRAQGASDAETQGSLMASLAAGNGSLTDVDALRGDRVQRELLACGGGARGVGEGLRAGVRGRLEVDGRLFEHAAKLYTGERGYWLNCRACSLSNRSRVNLGPALPLYAMSPRIGASPREPQRPPAAAQERLSRQMGSGRHLPAIQNKSAFPPDSLIA